MFNRTGRSILGSKKLQSIYKEDEDLKDEMLEKDTEDALSSEFKSEADSDTFSTDTTVVFATYCVPICFD